MPIAKVTKRATQNKLPKRSGGRIAQSPSTLSPFRYPGGKSALRKRIINWIGELGYRPEHFVEPFAGGASVGLAVAELDLVEHVTLIEIDPDVAAVWEVILKDEANLLAEQVRDFELNEASAREILNRCDGDLVSRAFRCLLLNRISRGGIMAPGAGWLNQGEGGKGIHSRWYPETLAKRIESVHALRHKITFIQGDGLEALKRFSAIPKTVAFVDPPYVANGRGAGLRLYKHYDVDCHELFTTVRDFSGSVVITYHRSEIVQREAMAIGIQCRTVNMHTAHTVAKRQLILHKPGQKVSDPPLKTKPSKLLTK